MYENDLKCLIGRIDANLEFNYIWWGLQRLCMHVET